MADSVFISWGGTTIIGPTTLTGPLYLPNGTAAAPSLASANYAGLGMYFTANRIRFAAAGENVAVLEASIGGLRTLSIDQLAMSIATQDVTISRIAARVALLGPTTGARMSWATDGTVQFLAFGGGDTAILKSRTFASSGVAFASLPTGVAGMFEYVTDSNTATWGATIAGGGANKVLAFYNGTNWTVAGA
jgi:hypothetical protein